MKYLVTLLLLLATAWMFWSGEYTLHHGLVTFFFFVSLGLVLQLSRKLEVVDLEGQPFMLAPWALRYGPWLVLEVIKANIDVMKRIVAPSLPISPTLVRIRAMQRTDLGHVIFANSITLTPGTITLDIDEGVLLVHAVSRGGAEDLLAGEMNRRCAAVEDLAVMKELG